MTSLKEKLKTAIRLRGYLSNAELYKICDEGGYKHDNGTRRMRDLYLPKKKNGEPNPFYDPHIIPDEYGGVIHGYKWVETPNSAPQTALGASSNGKTTDSKPVNRGSIPLAPATP